MTTLGHWVAIACVLISLAVSPDASGAALSEIGFPHGLTLRGPHATADVFFPLPNKVTDADLAIDLYPSPALDALSTVTVIVDDEPLATIGTRDGSRLVHVPIPRRLATGDFLHVRFAGDQALRRNEQCFDNDNPAVWTNIGPATALNTTTEGEAGIGAVWRTLAGDVPIALPSQPTLADLQTALTLAVALVARGAQPTIVAPSDPLAQIRIAPGDPALAVEWRPDQTASSTAAPIRVARAMRLVVATPAAARALVDAAPALRGVVTSAATAEPDGVVTPTPEAVTLAALGLRAPTLEVFSTAQATLEIPFSRLPAGVHPVAIELFGRGAAPPMDEALAVTLSAGGRLLWSQTFRGSAELDGVQVDLPEAVVRNHMQLSLRVVRVGTRRVCGADDALLFDLRDSTRLILADGYAVPLDFADFAVPGDRAALVRIDIDPAAAAPAVPLLARLLADAGARPGAIDVVGPGTTLDRPFIVVAATPPADIAETAPVRPDAGRVVLQRPSDGARVVLTDTGRLTLVQITAAAAVPGLWLSPGAASTLANPVALSAGDVAVFDGASAEPIAFDTHAAGVVLERPTATLAATLLGRWRSEVFVVAWIAVTVLAVFVVSRVRRARRGL